MAKHEEGARVRLQRAALELFRERGYDRTTAAEIAARAGVTERTFFRQFPDKKEVLFDGEAVLRAALTAAIAEAPRELAPLEALFGALHAIVPLLEGNRAFAEPRQDVIAATPALHERELAKLAVLAEALASALQERGVAPLAAALAAQVGMAAFAHVTTAWIADPDPPLGEGLDRAERELRALLGAAK